MYLYHLCHCLQIVKVLQEPLLVFIHLFLKGLDISRSPFIHVLFIPSSPGCPGTPNPQCFHYNKIVLLVFVRL